MVNVTLPACCLRLVSFLVLFSPESQFHVHVKMLSHMNLFVEVESNGSEKNGIPGRPSSPVPSAPPPNGASWQSCRKLIIVPRSAQKGYTVGHWPIPESFWPDINNDTLVGFL